MATPRSTSIGGGKPQTGRKTKAHGTGRVCAETGCTTILSRYNQNDYCWEHREVKFPRLSV